MISPTPTHISSLSFLLLPLAEMQSALDTSMSYGESERPGDPIVPSAPEEFVMTPECAEVLKGYLEDFQKSATEPRKRIVERAMGDLYALCPPGSPEFDKKVVKKVIVSSVSGGHC